MLMKKSIVFDNFIRHRKVLSIEGKKNSFRNSQISFGKILVIRLNVHLNEMVQLVGEVQ